MPKKPKSPPEPRPTPLDRPKTALDDVCHGRMAEQALRKKRKGEPPSEFSGRPPPPVPLSPSPALRYFSDSMRHLVCWPYSDEHLHRMAEDLGLKRGWFHAGGGRSHRRRHAHYDIPKKRVEEIRAKTEAVSPRELWDIISGQLPERLHQK